MSTTGEAPRLGGDRVRAARTTQLFDDLHRRAASMVDGFYSALPPYTQMPQSLVETDFARGTKLNVDLFFDYLRGGAEPSEEETRELIELAMGRVRDGTPLTDVLDRYRLGATFLWERLRESAAPGEHEALLDVSLTLLKYVTLVTTRIATAATQRSHDPRWELLERRRGIADALLTGQDPVEWANDPVIPVADAFLVAVFRLCGTNGGPASALRHRVEAIPGVFLRLEAGGWTALIPLQPGDNGASTLAGLTARLPAQQPGQAPPYWVGVGAARTRSEIPTMFAEARVLAELGRCLARREILCRRTNLQFEYTVAVSDAARPGLASVLAPLDAQPMLAETLEVFVDSGFNQLATARQLNVHRNTVTYRLSRVNELTGLDPHRPADAMTLSAARLARRLESASFAP
ncbi:CdaR family transcriptional regulator [Nocardia sp. XZ_19_385]|uniref:PucR family transcriptional regulator n=1 Tax=Nocardia sp. XZ_19_385 TaxID=2769488 RepID=UPI00188EFCB2|nr:PucR family transcriptional regulator [Nocardia sp. XZ_19_385]